MLVKDFILPLSSCKLIEKGIVKAKSPSNIALIKYWGKTEPQIPTNPSLSFTLKNSFTETTLSFSEKKSESQKIKVFLNGENKEDFVPKIRKFIERIENYASYIKEYDLEIETYNSFPHSSGIASSASGMNALAKCFVEIEELLGINYKKEDKQKRISFLSRLGSGSACRSNLKGFVVWGETQKVKGSSDLYAVSLESEVHDVYSTYRDAILLIHEGEKSVSSTVGHQLMNNHPYADTRFLSAKHNLSKMVEIVADNDLHKFGQLIEHEALSLHSMMMTSDPAFILMKPNTVEVLQKVWDWREITKNPLYFTLDAGANVHLLYPKSIENQVKEFIEKDLLKHTAQGKVIFDEVEF